MGSYKGQCGKIVKGVDAEPVQFAPGHHPATEGSCIDRGKRFALKILNHVYCPVVGSTKNDAAEQRRVTLGSQALGRGHPADAVKILQFNVDIGVGDDKIDATMLYCRGNFLKGEGDNLERGVHHTFREVFGGRGPFPQAGLGPSAGQYADFDGLRSLRRRSIVAAVQTYNNGQEQKKVEKTPDSGHPGTS